MFKKMKISTYLITCFASVLFCTIVISFVSLIGLRDISTNMDELINETLATQQSLVRLRLETNIAARNVREMALTTNTSEYASFISATNESLENITTERNFMGKYYSNTSNLNQLNSYLDAWIDIAANAANMLQNGQREEAISVLLNECSPALKDLDAISLTINNDLTTMSSIATENNTKNLNFYLFLVVILFIAATVISVAATILATSNIVNGINLISNFAEELSKGNLDAEIHYDGKNAIGRLAETMQFSFHELSKYVHAIQTSMTNFSNGNFKETEIPFEFLGDFAAIGDAITDFSKKINFVLGDVNETSGQVFTGAEQVSVGAQTLAAGATQQASSVEELSATINEISTQVTRTAENSQIADGLAKSAGQVVEKSLNEMNQLVKAIEDIAESSEGISKIIKDIDDIAFQTNILALNAAVEAARAGQAGKGFAVVADEVRNLAQKSAEAAKRTTQLIENSLESVNRGTNLANNTHNAFTEVAENSAKVLSVVEEIAAASKDQDHSVSQVKAAVTQISSVVQMNSATSEESAAASEELSGQANVLKSLISQFQLNSTPSDTNKQLNTYEPLSPNSTSTTDSSGSQDATTSASSMGEYKPTNSTSSMGEYKPTNSTSSKGEYKPSNSTPSASEYKPTTKPTKVPFTPKKPMASTLEKSNTPVEEVKDTSSDVSNSVSSAVTSKSATVSKSTTGTSSAPTIPTYSTSNDKY